MSKKVYSDKKTKPEKIEQSKMKEIIGLVIYCIIVVAIMFFVIKFIGQRTIVIGDSMNPTLHEDENLITDKTFLITGKYYQNIYVFKHLVSIQKPRRKSSGLLPTV